MKNVEMKELANRDERGVALIHTLMIMALMLALLMGISLTAISELGVTSAYANQTIAMEAAEAGLNQAVSLVRNYKGTDFTSLLKLRPGASGGSVASTNTEYDFNTNYLLGNNPFITANASNFGTGATMIDYDLTSSPSPGCPLRDGVTGAVVPGAYYKVSLIDNEPSSSTTSPKVPNFTPPSPFAESTGTHANDANYDVDNRIVIYSTGTYSNASVTLEGWVAFLSFPALLSNQDISISGNAQLLGEFGGVHTNGNLNISGSPYIEKTATATQAFSTSGGGFTIDGFYGGLQPRIPLPHFVTKDPGPNTSPRIQDYLTQEATALLIDPGFADGAHKTDSTDSNLATVRLNNLAQRLNVSYASLITALDQGSGSSNRIVQTNEAAAKIVRPSHSPGSEPAGTAGILAVSNTGWSYTGGSNASWGIQPSGGATVGINVNDGSSTGNIYYVVGQDNYPSGANGGNVSISGNLGGNLDGITILATGSITIAGTTNFTSKLKNLSTPELPPFVQVDVLFAAVEDVKIRGDVDASSAPGGPTFNGITYCGEQFDLSGNGNFNGQVIGYGNTDMSGSPVSANVESGSFQLTLNNGNSFGTVKMVSWRQIKR